MPDIGSLKNLYLVLGFVVPGLIILFVRTQFLTGRSPKHSEAILSYITISVIYYALSLPLVEWTLSINEPGFQKSAAWFFLIFIGPMIFGGILGLVTQKEWVRKIAQSFGLNPVHFMPTAWDWKFGNMHEQWVMVTLKDKTCFAGYCGKGSFMSSDPNERDLYIEQIYDLDKQDKWEIRERNSVYISHGEIRTIEFWPIKNGDTEND